MLIIPGLYFSLSLMVTGYVTGGHLYICVYKDYTVVSRILLYHAYSRVIF